MPLYKKQPFPLAEKPSDLKPNERVYKVRFTKEIFRDYSEYLKRINIYRRRIWTSKATGKSNLTYEEALISERKAAEKVKQFPKEFTAPVLREIQFSMLTLRELANAIFEKLQGRLSEGNELYARKNNRVYPCKIVKVLEDDQKTRYEVLWLGKDKKVTGNSLIKGEDLIKKLPFTKEVLKSFIKDCTYRNSPWVLHDKLAELHGISSHPPEELKGKVSLLNGLVVCSRKRKKGEGGDAQGTIPGQSQSASEENKRQRAESIRYPIDDLLVEPAEDDEHLTERPSPCKDFNVPMDCVGDLLMVWDFCTSFGKLLYLSPFSLEDFESALCHKDSNVVLIAEAHSALLRLLMKDNGAFSEYMQNKKRKPKITLITWSDYLSDFLDVTGVSELHSHRATVRRGHYGLLSVHVKLEILRELITQALETNLFRDKLDEYVEQGQALAATRREEAIDEAKKKREEKERLKKGSAGEEESAKDVEENIRDDSLDNQNGNIGRQNGNLSTKSNGKTPFSEQKHSSDNSETDSSSRKISKKQKDESSKRKALKLMKGDIKETIENKSKEQRREYIQREIEKRFIRTNALGKDRDYNRYWFFRRDGRIFVENSESTEWGYYSSMEELTAFMGSLNPKGLRERALKKQLEKHYEKICSGLQKRSKELAQRTAAEEAAVRRSSRVRAPPRANPALAFLKYENRWKED